MFSDLAMLACSQELKSLDPADDIHTLSVFCAGFSCKPLGLFKVWVPIEVLSIGVLNPKIVNGTGRSVE